MSEARDGSDGAPERPDEALAWARLLLTVLDEGRRTATDALRTV